MSTCSVVMVSYHTGPVLFASMKTVLTQRGLAELVLVDNGNPPDILARLQQMALTEPRLRIVSGQGNVGIAKGCNIGVRDAKGEYVVLMNPDCLLPPDALSGLAAGLDAVPGAMLAGCWLVHANGSEQRGGRSELLTPATALSEVLGLYCLFNLARFSRQDTPMPAQTHEIPAISGACMCLRKSDYIRLFGMDEGFFIYAQDIDLCLRVHHIGGKVVCVPGVRVTRMRSDSEAVSPHFREWQKARGLMRYFDKHYRGRYVPGFLALVRAGIVLRAAVRIADGTLRRLIRGEERDAASRRLMVLASGLAELPESEKFEGRTVLVTGATGQIGLCVLRRLIAAGASVVAVSRADPIPFEHRQLRWIRGDLADKTLALQGQGIDSLIHCAPLEHLPPVIDLLADAGVMRVVAFGSASVFARAVSKNVYENGVVNRLGMAEAAIAERAGARGIDWSVLRPTLIYGVGLDSGVTPLAKFIQRFGFFPIYPPACGRRQPVHADDLALGALLALDNRQTCGKAYNVSGGEILTYHDMLERLFTLYRRKPHIIATTLLPFALDAAGWLLHKKHINRDMALRMNDDLVFFHDEAKKDFGFSPRPFLTGGLRDIEGF